MQSAEGHRCDTWDRTAIWDGRLRIVTKGRQLIILLEHSKGKEAGQLFAACPVNNDPKKPPSVECVLSIAIGRFHSVFISCFCRFVLDSSRYFVLRLDDGKGRYAYMGLSFATRDEAFDFKTALQHEQNQEREEEKARAFMESAPARDLSLHSGSIKIKVPLSKKSSTADDEFDFDQPKAPVKLVALPKPASSKKPTAAPDNATTIVSSSSFGAAPADDFEWSDFDSANAAAPANSTDQWVDFS
jgi:hypothetical protein